MEPICKILYNLRNPYFQCVKLKIMDDCKDYNGAQGVKTGLVFYLQRLCAFCTRKQRLKWAKNGKIRDTFVQ